jgi:hypothetical protein
METHNKCWIKGYNEGIKTAIEIIDKHTNKDCFCAGCRWNRHLNQLLEKEIK